MIIHLKSRGFTLTFSKVEAGLSDFYKIGYKSIKSKGYDFNWLQKKK